MRLFDRLLGKKEPDAAPTESASAGAGSDQIRVYDKFGRELFVTRDQWRTSILPGSLAANRNNPEQLSGIIIGALTDGFFPEALEPAQHLRRIDPVWSRGSCIYGIALMKNNQLDAAEQVLQAHIKQHGDDGAVLTNLAKVYAARNETDRADATLWHALEVDPNQDGGLAWYAASASERRGKEAGIDAWRRVARIPGSWRAQLWLARTALESQNHEQAMDFYRESLANVGSNVPTDFLMQMSGDLGNHGLMRELLRLTEPRFVPEAHGLQVGNNLIKANLEMGRIDRATEILNRLNGMNRPDWKQHLSFWDTEIAKARIAGSVPEPSTPLNVTMLVIEGPIWLRDGSPVSALFPLEAKKQFVVSFLGCTAEFAIKSEQIQYQISEPVGRMSRALPLLLAEHIDFTTASRVQTLVPVITGDSSGFVAGGVAWSDEHACDQALQAPLKSDYVVTIHINAQAEPWMVLLRLINLPDRECIGTFSVPLSRADPERGAVELAGFLTKFLADHAGIGTRKPPPCYRTPEGATFGDYLLRLEQLLAVRCSGLPEVRKGFLYGERDILDGSMGLCLTCPDSVLTRTLLAITLAAMKDVRGDVVREYRDKVSHLHMENPLAEPAQGILTQLFAEVFAA